MVNKTWKIIVHEYTRHVLRKRFIFALLSVPLWILISIGAGLLSIVLQVNPKPVGYVDQAGLLDEIDVNKAASGSDLNIPRSEFIPFGSETDARRALENKEIQAFFVIPPGYTDSLTTRLIYLEEPNGLVKSQFSEVLRAGLLKNEDPLTISRLLEGSTLEIEATQDDSQSVNNDWFKIAAPMVAGLFLMVSVFTSAGYLMQAIVEEKENRTMELLATSLSPVQIMGGKIIALISVGLTQVLVWSLFPILAILLARSYIPFLQRVIIDWKMIALVILLALPTFILISTLMATIGAAVTDSREGQQTSTIITLPAMSPYLLLSALLGNPGGIIAVGLSLFPLTAALTILIRMAFASVPFWQILLSVTILLISTAGSVWLSGKVFRVGMLRYGKRMSLREIFQVFTPIRKNLPKVPLPHE